MRPLSATECITPAIERTKLVLFSPFRKGRTWKLCATAYLSIGGSMFFPFALIYLAFVPAVRRAAGMPLAMGLVAGAVLLTALFTWIFHLCSRLQFAYFDLVVNRGEFVAPAWRKYGPQALPWTGFKILLGTVIALAAAAPTVAYVRHILPLLETLPRVTPGQPPPPQLMVAVAGFYAGYALFLLLLGAIFLVHSLLADFIVPSLALEDTGMKEAFRRMGELMRREPGEFTLYVLLKLGLGMAGYMGATMVWEIVFLLASVIVGAVVFLFGFLLHLAGVPTVALIVLGVLIGAAWYFFWMFYALLLTIGPVFTFLEAYALYFLGGRYPMLGDLLDRSTPRAPVPYPNAVGYAAYPPPPPPDTLR